MDKAEREIMFMRLHQFWLFAFKTVRYGGVGPHVWTASLLGSDKDTKQSKTTMVVWPMSWWQDSLIEQLLSGLSRNVLSSIDATDIPITLTRLLENSNISTDQLLVECVAFSVATPS
ncbi:hypothetical protein PV10_03382 [Exophiala mesophila]|uniref:Uncharacterized protein n=1 Tax=Exophiala mesophila TaxID=212818 RepID=A0A0D1ZM73_EXOME|nr:uncharacterized protein PV10_03382 [Exophiala mesophila]KIV95767.1 hypothetical protein PV10_03382 [Exophiala mesophila]